jgi:hypothetical protein
MTARLKQQPGQEDDVPGSTSSSVLEYRVSEVEKEVKETRTEILQKLDYIATGLGNLASVVYVDRLIKEQRDSFDYKLAVVKDGYESRAKSNSNRIGKLEGNQAWLIKTIIGELIVIVAGAVALMYLGEKV